MGTWSHLLQRARQLLQGDPREVLAALQDAARHGMGMAPHPAAATTYEVARLAMAAALGVTQEDTMVG